MACEQEYQTAVSVRLDRISMHLMDFRQSFDSSRQIDRQRMQTSPPPPRLFLSRGISSSPFKTGGIHMLPVLVEVESIVARHSPRTPAQQFNSSSSLPSYTHSFKRRRRRRRRRKKEKVRGQQHSQASVRLGKLLSTPL